MVSVLEASSLNSRAEGEPVDSHSLLLASLSLGQST